MQDHFCKHWLRKLYKGTIACTMHWRKADSPDLPAAGAKIARLPTSNTTGSFTVSAEMVQCRNTQHNCAHTGRCGEGTDRSYTQQFKVNNCTSKNLLLVKRQFYVTGCKAVTIPLRILALMLLVTDSALCHCALHKAWQPFKFQRWWRI